MGADFVVLVDEENNELGTMEKLQAHKKGVLHRAISVIVFNSKNQILLQKRAANKYHCAGLWSNTCCSHPMLNEASLDAANRRLKEEMGVRCSLKPAFNLVYRADLDNGLIEHEFDEVFVGVTNDTPILNQNEASAYCYKNIEEIENDFKTNKENYTPWFVLMIEKFKVELKEIR